MSRHNAQWVRENLLSDYTAPEHSASTDFMDQQRRREQEERDRIARENYFQALQRAQQRQQASQYGRAGQYLNSYDADMQSGAGQQAISAARGMDTAINKTVDQNSTIKDYLNAIEGPQILTRFTNPDLYKARTYADQYLSDDERNRYLYVVGKGGLGAGNDYLDTLNLSERASQDAEQTMREAARRNPIAGTAMNVALKPAEGTLGLVNVARTGARALTGQDKIGAEDPTFRGTRMRNALLEGSSEGVQEMVGANPEGTSGYLVNQAVGIVNSLADSQFGARVLAGPLVDLVNAGSAANSVLLEHAEDDISTLQLGLDAIAQGTAEAAFEHISIENTRAMQHTPVRGIKDVLKNLAKSFVSEGSEELFTSIADTVADDIILNRQSDDYKEYQQRVANGEPSSLAFLGVVLGDVKDAAIEGIAGGIAGLGSGAIGSVEGRVFAQREGNRIFGGNPDLKALADNVDVDSEHYTSETGAQGAREFKALAEQLNEKQQRGEQLTAKDRLDLYRYWSYAQDYEDQAIADVARANGEEDSRRAHNIVSTPAAPQEEARTAYTEELNDRSPENVQQEEEKPRPYQQEAMGREEITQRLANATTSTELATVYQQVQDAGNSEGMAYLKSVFPMYTGRMVSGIEDVNERTQSLDVINRLAVEGTLTQQRAYQAGLEGREVNPDEMSDDIRIAYNEGQIARREAVAAEYRAFSETVESMRMPAMQESYVAHYNGEMPVRQYHRVFSDIFEAGRQVDAEKQSPEQIAEKLQKTIHNAGTAISLMAYTDINGNEHSGSQIAEQIFNDAIKAARQDRADVLLREKSKKISEKGTGEFHDLRKNPSSRQDLRPLNGIAKIAGITIEVMDRPDFLKKSGGADVNGLFDQRTGKLILNGDSGRIVTTALHEIGEFADAFNTDEYRSVVQAVHSTLQDALGLETYRALRTPYSHAYTVNGDDSTVSYETFTESDIDKEIANDVIWRILGDEDLLTALGDDIDQQVTEGNLSAEQAKTIRQKIIDFIQKVFDGLKKIVSGGRRKPATKQIQNTYGKLTTAGEAKMQGFQAEAANIEELEQHRDALIKAIKGAAKRYIDTEVTLEDIEETVPQSVRFSLNAPVEQTKDLLAVHNLTSDQLLADIELGGLPSPSIAIIRAGMGHSMYGDVSLVFDKDTIDPKRTKKNKVYSQDAWTPTFPTVEYKLDGKKLQKIRDRISEIVPYKIEKALNLLSVDEDNASNKINQTGGNAVEAYANNETLKYAYLKENGIDIEIPTREKRLSYKYSNDDIRMISDMLTEEQYDEINSNLHTFMQEKSDVVEMIRRALNESFRNRIRASGKSTLKLAERELYPELSFSDVDNLVRAIDEYRDNGIEQEPDTSLLGDAVNQRTDDEGFRAWLADLFDGVVVKKGLRNNKSIYTNSGNRRSWDALHDEFTLENIVKIMNQEEDKGAAAFWSQSAIQAISARDFRTIDEIRQAKGQLKKLSDEEYKALKEAHAERFEEIASALIDETGVRFVEINKVADSIADAMRKYQSAAGIEKELKKWHGEKAYDGIGQDIVNLRDSIASMPTGYFEAKPKRAVWLDEVKYAVLPDSAPSELLEALDKNGIVYKTYATGDDVSRQQVMDGLQGVRFSRNVDNEGRQLSEGQDKYFKDSKVRDNAGNLMVMYHGTPTGGFTVFKNDLTFFSPDKEYASKYESASASARKSRKQLTNPQTYKVYLNIKHPFDIRDPKTKERFINEYVKGGYALGINPYTEYKDITKTGLPDWNEADNIYEWMEENDLLDTYDGIVVDEGGYPDGKGGVLDRGIAYITFKPNQIKNVDNLTPTSNPDIRYSKQVDKNRSLEHLSVEDLQYLLKQDIANPEKLSYNEKTGKYEVRSPYGKLIQEYDYDGLIEHVRFSAGALSLDDLKNNPFPKRGVSLGTMNWILRREGEGDWSIIHDDKDDDLKVFHNGKLFHETSGGIHVFLHDYADYITGKDKSIIGAQAPAPGVVLSTSRDSKGRELSEGQKKYFAKTRALDQNGNLLRLYHGTRSGGFTQFDPLASDDYLNIFVSDSPDIAQSYSNSTEAYTPESQSVDELNEVLDREWYGNRIEETDSGYDLAGAPASAHTLRDVREFVQDNIINESPTRVRQENARSINYEVYANLTNPLEINANFANWNRIDFEGQTLDTRKIGAIAKERGYDGVIFRNLPDMGRFRRRKVAATIIIGFSPEQFKSIDNLNPTSNPDIRYSRQVDSEGNKLSDDQKKYFADSQVRDDQGNLLRMYHGTNTGGFSIFDAANSDDGRTLFFSADPGVSSTYASSEDGGSVYPVYLNVTNPLVLDAEGSGAFSVQRKSATPTFEITWESPDAYDNVWVINVTDADGNTNTIETTFDDSGVSELQNIIGYTNYEDFAEYLSYQEFPENWEGQKRHRVREINAANTPHRFLAQYEDRTTRGWAKWAQAHGHDGVIFKNIIDVASHRDQYVAESTVVAAFNSDQVKSVFNHHPTNDPDIRRSVDLSGINEYEDGSIEAAYRDQELASILRQGSEALKGQKVDSKLVNKIAGEILRKYKSAYDRKTLADNLEKLFAYAQEKNRIDYEDLSKVIREVAKPVVEGAAEKVGAKEYKAFMDILRSRKIALTDRQKDEVASHSGSYGAFVKSMRGISFSSNGTPLDSMWSELVDASGGFLDPDAAEGDMPILLQQAMHDLTPYVANTFQGDADDVAADMAMEIIERYYEEAGKAQSDAKLKQKLKDASDKMKKEAEEFRQNVRREYEERLKEARKEQQERSNRKRREGKYTQKDMDEAIARMRARNKRQQEKQKEAQQQRYQKQQIMNAANKLLNMLINPTPKAHVPKVLEEPVIDLLTSINFVVPTITRTKDGKYQTKILVTEEENGRIKRHWETFTSENVADVIGEFQESLERTANGSKDQRKWSEKMRSVKDLYNQAVTPNSELSFTLRDFLEGLDQSLAADLDKIIENRDGAVAVSMLNAEELKTINKVIRNIMSSINKIDKLYSNPDYINGIHGLAEQTMEHAKALLENRKVKDRRRGGRIAKTFLTLDNATPETFMHAIGGAGDQIYKMLTKAQNTKAFDLRNAQEYMIGDGSTDKYGRYNSGILKGVSQKELSEWSGDKAKIVYDGGNMKLTVADLMYLYELQKRKDAESHKYGGFEAADKIINGKVHQDTTPHFMSSETIREITDLLTDRQKEIADDIQKFLAVECAAWGNDVSMNLYGYEKFVDPNYIPMSVDKRTTRISNQQVAEGLINTIKNQGFTKALIPNAANPLIIMDIFDVFTNHVTGMAAYHAYAAPITDIIRWDNFKAIDEVEGFDGEKYGRYNTVKESLQTIFGDDGQRYLVRLVQDLNNQERRTEVGASRIQALMGNYKSAATLANIRVVLQQPTAWLRAGEVIDYKWLTEGLKPNAAAAELQKRSSAISWVKSQGNIDGYITQSMKATITGAATLRDRVNGAAGYLAGKADDVTWAALYRAVYAEQKAEHGGKTDTVEFENAVNDRFDELIARTQVVDGTLMRSQMMRSKDGLNTVFSAFMAEPTKSYNMFLRDYYDIIQGREKTGKVRKEDLKHLSRTLVAFLLTNVVNAVAQSLADAARDEKEDKNYWQKFLEAYPENLISDLNMLNNIPIVKDFYAVVEKGMRKILFNESGYSSGTGDMLTDGMDALFTAIGNIKNQGEKTKKTPYGLSMDLISAVSKVTGIPAYNLMRDVTAIYNTLNDFWGGKNIRRKKATKDELVGPAMDPIENSIRNGTDFKAAIEKAVTAGASYEQIETTVTSTYKPEYIELMEAGKTSEATMLENRLMAIYQYLDKQEGQKSTKKNRVKDWYK